jgi:anti-sigma factor ChrR (cupin superfamily)
MATLLQAQFLPSISAPQLMLERLYYAEGRHHPQHPRHGSFEGLSQLSSP